MKEENKIKQSIIAISLILLFCGYYLTPASTAENEDRVEVPSYAIDTQTQPDELLHTGYGFEKTDSVPTFFPSN